MRGLERAGGRFIRPERKCVCGQQVAGIRKSAERVGDPGRGDRLQDDIGQPV